MYTDDLSAMDYDSAYEEYQWNVWSWWNQENIYPSMSYEALGPEYQTTFEEIPESKMSLLSKSWKKGAAKKKEKPKTEIKKNVKGKISTTLMLRNIPNKYCQRELLEDLETFGFVAGEHMDFFYLPIDPATGANLGYAFVNLVSKEMTDKFREDINETQLPRHLTRKVVEVGLAAVQGFKENRQYYARSSAMRHADASRRPLFWNEDALPINEDGVVREDPKPEVEEESQEQDWVSTLMLRNLRNKYTQTNLLSELAQLGFHPEGQIDFFYLPIDSNTNANLGYAFVNFTSTDHVDNFKNLSGLKLSKIFKKNMVVVDEASVQGIQANWDLYARSAPMNSSDPLRRPLFWPRIPVKGRSEAWSTDLRRPPTAQGEARGGQSTLAEIKNRRATKPSVSKNSIRPPPGLSDGEQKKGEAGEVETGEAGDAGVIAPPPGLDLLQ